MNVLGESQILWGEGMEILHLIPSKALHYAFLFSWLVLSCILDNKTVTRWGEPCCSADPIYPSPPLSPLGRGGGGDNMPTRAQVGLSQMQFP